MKIDGHIHSPYCPHGSSDTFEQYISTAIRLGYQEISFTEHAPLPENFEDPTPNKDSGMNPDLLESYIHDLQILKQKYQSKIKINIGLEVDYIIHFEKQTTQFLNKYGPFLDDSILSVHFLHHQGNYFCVDFSPNEFERICRIVGSVENVYDRYYQLVKKSVMADLGPYKPKRIGHMTLVHKFQKKYPCTTSFQHEILEILSLIKKHKLALDYNGAGVSKPLCQEPYPSDWIAMEAAKQKIPLIYGSDAHTARDLNQGYSKLIPIARENMPTITE